MYIFFIAFYFYNKLQHTILHVEEVVLGVKRAIVVKYFRL